MCVALATRVIGEAASWIVTLPGQQKSGICVVLDTV